MLADQYTTLVIALDGQILFKVTLNQSQRLDVPEFSLIRRRFTVTERN